MGVSFKVAKAGTRYRPKLLQIEYKDDEDGPVSESHQSADEGKISGAGSKVAEPSNSLNKPALHSFSEDLEVSFSLNLFQNGFSIGKAAELFNDEPKQLHPYDRASETLFSAIEYGWLPGDLFDNIPSKFVNGALLCEIQDYRISLPQKGGTAASVENSPIVHKVLLRMRTENVVKEISLISDDSWTYADLLEIESRILKALHPDLLLNPQPLQDRYCGELLRKKLDLGIAWSWKRGKPSEKIASNTAFSNSYHMIQISGSCAIQNSSSQFGLEYQDRGVTSLQHKILSSNLNPQENNVVVEKTSPSNPLMMDNQLADGCKQSVLTTLTTSNFVPKQHYSYCNSDPTKSISLVSGEKRRCETEAPQEHIAKKPKKGHVDFSQQQLPGSQAESSLAPEQQWKNKLLHQQIVAKKLLGEKFQDKSRPFLLVNSSQSVLKDTSMLPYTVKQKTTETGFCGSDARKTNDSCFLMDRRISQSNNQQLEQQPLSPLLRDNTPPTYSLWSRIAHPVNKSLRNGSATLKSESFQNPQVSTVKQKTAETGFCGSDARKTNDSCFLMDRRISQSNNQQLEQQPLSPLLRDNTPPTYSLWSRIAHPVNKSLRNRNATLKSESFRNPQVTTVKQKTTESGFFGSDARKTNDSCFLMDRRISQSNNQQLEQQPLSPLLRDNTPPTYSLWSRIAHPVNESLRNGSATQKSESFWNPQVTTGVKSATISSQHNDSVKATINSQHNDSLAREASVPTKRKMNSQIKGSNMKVVGSFASMSTSNAANGNSLPVGNIRLDKPSETEVNSVLKRLVKIEELTQWYGLNKRKQRKPFSHTTSLVPFHPLSSEDNRRLNVCKTRTLTFVHHVYEGNEIPMVDREGQITLVISEKLNEGILEACIHYGVEKEIGSFAIPLLFSGSHSADIFASQFTSLMADEGYHMDSRVEPSPLKARDDSSTPQSGVITDAAKTTGTVELHHPTLKSGLSPCMFNPTTNSLPAHNATQLPSQNILSRGDLLPTGNIQSAFSNPQLGVATPISPAQCLEIFSKCAHLQLQMQQGLRQPKVMQREMLVGGLGVAAGGLGVIQPGGGIQGLGNSNVSPFSNMVGTGGSTPMLMGVHNPWIGSGSQFNNLGSNISSSSESKQLLGLISNNPVADMAKLRTAEDQGGALISGVPIQRNASRMPMHTLNLPGSARNLNNQQQPQQQLNERLHMLQLQEEMKPFLHPPAMTGLTVNVGLPSSQDTLQKSYVQPLMSPQQLGPKLAFVQMNSNNMMGSPENLDLSSRMHRKHRWCN